MAYRFSSDTPYLRSYKVCHSYSCNSLITFSFTMNVWLHFSTRINIICLSFVFILCPITINVSSLLLLVLFNCKWAVSLICMWAQCTMWVFVCNNCSGSIKKFVVNITVFIVYICMHAVKQWIDVTKRAYDVHTTHTWEFKWLK